MPTIYVFLGVRDVPPMSYLSSMKIILNSITEQIRGNIYSLLIDEATDVSDKEQMTVLLRYLSKRGFIIERLVGVENVKETSANCLKATLQKLFTN